MRGQESRLIASISGDKECINLFNEGCADMHSLVAKMSYPEIVKDCPIEQIKTKFHQQRQDSKKIEFAINYGGDYNTIANNMSMPVNRAKKIYENYMKGLSGIASYQKDCKKAILNRGYVTLNPLTGHKAYWWDWKACMYVSDLYNLGKYEEIEKFNKKIHFIKVKFDNSVEDYSPVYLHNIMEFNNHDLVKKKISDWTKRSVNFRIQGTGALCFKLSLIKLWNYLIQHNLIFTVKFCIVVHDEFDIEAPEEIADDISKVLGKCMEQGASIFCTKVHLGADIELNDYWVH